MSLNIDTLEAWTTLLRTDAAAQLGGAVLANHNAHEALVDRGVMIRNSTKVFNTSVSTEGAPVTNQKASGRCWLFAAGNVLRLRVMERLLVKEFQFSQSYWFFWDKLEKCNYFLHTFYANIDSAPQEDVRSRLNQFLLDDPTCDGGQFDMFVNIAAKYGMVPYDVYPDAYSATASRTLNFMLKTKLREFAEQLRRAKADGKMPDFAGMQQELHRLMVMFLGQPPGPNEQVHWDYRDKDDAVHLAAFTPLLFYKDTVDVDLTTWVSLLNDPRNAYDTVVRIDKLGNVVGGKEVSYLNVDIDALAAYAVQRIRNNHGVFFGTHTPIYMDKKRGIMDELLFNYALIGYRVHQSKASRIEYKQSLMTHAMVLTAVHLDESGNPVRWRVENSWGKDLGQNGYFVMDHQYFKDYVYQIVVGEDELEEKHKKVWDAKENVVVLPPWDPMGALAVFDNKTVSARM